MQEINLPLRGARDYLLAADLFDAVQNTFPKDYQARDIQMLCFAKAKKEVRIEPFAPESLPLAYARYKDKEQDLLLLPLAQSPQRRIEDREKELLPYFALSGRKLDANVPSSLPFSPVYQAVAAFKQLLHQPQELGPAAKFIVARLSLQRLFSGPFSLVYTRLVGGAFYEAEISQNGEALGKLYFAREQQAIG